MSQFAFLQSEWPAIFESAVKVERHALPDPRTACFYARRALEQAVDWLYRNERSLSLPYQDNLSALIHEPSFKVLVGQALFAKASLLTKLGNQAVHSGKPIFQYDAQNAARELFHVCFWLARSYSAKAKPADSLSFSATLLPAETAVPAQTQEQIKRLAEDLARRDTKLSELFANNEQLEKELEATRLLIDEIKKKNAATPDQHDYSEAETRDAFIDVLLKEAGWALSDKRDIEYEVRGMPNTPGKGFVDYVLWGNDGKPLALVEAKRNQKSALIGQQQAKLYADCLEKEFGQRPVIFYTNGYEHWLWDDLNYPPREVQGFYKKDELELLILRRQTRTPLADAEINKDIVERYYQTRAIRRIGESFEKDLERKALVVMATGAGKTRTVIALCDLLIRCNWVKRVLFLADRVALVKQAVGNFKKHLPSSSPVNLVTEPNTEGRVFVSTYPTMMGLIGETDEGGRRFGVGHFDLVVIDEAHRSVYQKYGAIFKYFDALLVGLTATPREEIDRDTYGLFDLEKGVPTDSYTLKEAVADKFLVPAKAVSVPLKFQREGIRYDQLSEEEKQQWDDADWGDEGPTPHEVDPEAVNKWLFNKDTVDKVLEHLMTRGQTVAGGDRLGKTIIFAKNQDHAEFISARFNINYPHHKGAFARVVHCGLPYAQTLIDDFSAATKAPHIAISVDMLDTGIDVPEAVNLVFFKLVRSKTKFWQMVGRGTRLCPDLFGPGKDKEFFYIFDFCGNLEFFKENPEATEGSLGESLAKRLFKARLEVIGAVEAPAEGKAVQEVFPADAELCAELRTLLHKEVAAMNLENFVIRPQRRLVEKYAKLEAWRSIDLDARQELASKVAGLPSELPAEDEEARRYDLLILNLQLCILKKEPGFERLKKQVQTIAGLLQEKSAIPGVKAEMAHILELQTDAWWEDVTLTMLESSRKRLRSLVKLIEKQQRKPIYTDFEDQISDAVSVALEDFTTPASEGKFRDKARAFLRAHQDHLSIHKLRTNQALTDTDLAELERMLLEYGVARPAELEATKQGEGLGLFVRDLIGLDREAAKEALNTFTSGRVLTSQQIEFVNLIIDHLTEHGVVKAELLYESPFTDLSPQGPEGVFSPALLDELIVLLSQIQEKAAS